jgi:hypothetical protein
MALAALLAVGALTKLPVFNPGGAKGLTLSAEERALLAGLKDEVEIEAILTPMGEARFGPTLDLYARFSPKIKIKKTHGPGKAMSSGQELSLALPDVAIIRSKSFEETITPLTQAGLIEAFHRLATPIKIVYSLIGDGEKSSQDQSPKGLSNWARALERRRILVRDHFWAPGAPLPKGGAALILAGPTAALDPEKNAELILYLAMGGKILVFQDPLAQGIAPDAFEALGLKLGTGLIVDPETAWAGTDDFFPVSQDFPAHPATIGLTRPVVWPLTGAIFATKELAEDPDNPLAAKISVLALSSPDSYLETDRASIAERRPRQNPGEDSPGPLALAVAAELKGGGRLALLADSDLASNVFIANPGNLDLVDGLINWLVGSRSFPEDGPKAILFNLTQSRARIAFWLPAIVWPGLIVFIWALYFRSQRADPEIDVDETGAGDTTFER